VGGDKIVRASEEQICVTSAQTKIKNLLFMNLEQRILQFQQYLFDKVAGVNVIGRFCAIDRN
jgi:hypothetical protein